MVGLCLVEAGGPREDYYAPTAPIKDQRRIQGRYRLCDTPHITTQQKPVSLTASGGHTFKPARTTIRLMVVDQKRNDT
jgi:hypothetical protein